MRTRRDLPGRLRFARPTLRQSPRLAREHTASPGARRPTWAKDRGAIGRAARHTSTLDSSTSPSRASRLPGPMRPARTTRRLAAAEHGLGGRPTEREDLDLALCLVLSVWTLLLGAGLLVRQGVAEPVAVFAAFLLGALLAAAVRTSRPRHRRGVSSALFALGLLAGLASYPAWVAGVSALGQALGGTLPRHVPPGIASPWLGVATLALAPVMEEWVYRERLLPALAAHVGPASAVVASSAAFALPHLEPWAVLTTFLLGLALGPVMLLSRAVALCIGMHAGLNLAAATWGVPPAGSALSPLLGGAIGVAYVAGGIAWARSARATAMIAPSNGVRRVRLASTPGLGARGHRRRSANPPGP